MRLPAPMIEGTLPAFYADGKGIAKLAIPFSMSRAVSQEEVQGFELKLKSVYGSTTIDLVSSQNWDKTNNIVYFNINTNKKGYFIGNFYKAQIAYLNEKDVGYFSPVGVIKLTSKPQIKIDRLTIGTNNLHLTTYTGIYNQYQKDISEKVHSYRFVVKDENDIIVEDTGYLLHNRNNDDNQYESYDNFYFSKALEDNKKYKIQYSVKTNNNLEISTPFYNIVIRKSVAPNFKVDIELNKNDENGYIEILLKRNKENEKNNEVIKGSFLLTRSSEKSNFTEWEEISKFNLTSHRSSLKTIKDFAIEQGVKYKYSIQQFNDQGLYSERNISKEISVDYEHSFLYDGERQLKIKFNPKMNNFKTDLLEAKIDTIGSKYPFIFRNGNVAYKEFPISGLISYLADEEGLFINNKERFKDIYRFDSTKIEKVQTLVGANFYKKYYDSYYIKLKNGKFQSWVSYIYDLNKEVEKKYKEEIKNQELEINKKKASLNLILYKDYDSLNVQEKAQWEQEIDALAGLMRKEVINELGIKEIKIINKYAKYDKYYTKIIEQPTYEMKKNYLIGQAENKLEDIYKQYEKEHISITNYNEIEKELVKYFNLNLLYENINMQQKKSEWKNYELASNNLEDYNFLLERNFKLEVLDWLNNGKPKLFKSPSEGMYLVRIMNVALTPEETINRLIHNFSATAYEIGNPTYKDMYEHGIIDLSYSKDKYYKITTIPLATTDYNYYFAHKNIYEEIDGVYYAYGNILPNGAIKYFKIEDIQPGSIIGINGENIMIGATGTYESPVEVNSVFIPSGSKLMGQITIGYLSDVINSFDEIIKTESRDILGHQIFGAHDNVIEELNNIGQKVTGIYNIKAYPREVKEAFYYRHYQKIEKLENSEEFYNYYSKIFRVWDEEEERWVWDKTTEPTHPATIANIGNIKGFEEQYQGLYQREELIFSIDISKLENIPQNTFIINSDLKEKYKDYLLYEYIIRPLDEHPEYGANEEIDNTKYIGKIKIYLNNIGKLVNSNFAYKIDSLNKYYKDIRFEEINRNLDKQIANDLGELKWQERTSTNYPYLSSIKNKGKQDSKLALPVYYYILPEKQKKEKDGIMSDKLIYCIDSQVYKQWKEEKREDLNKYFPYQAIISFNGNEIDIEETRYFNSGALDDLKVLTTYGGVYIEMFYQIQIIEYNKNTLINYNAKKYEETKQKLDEYHKILSREYAYNKEINNALEDYINELEEVYNNYENVYSNYIEFLNEFIKALEEE